MAAPGIAASALLLREYFLSHYSKHCRSHYAFCRSFSPSGKRERERADLPSPLLCDPSLSGYLLKAVLIHATVPVKQSVITHPTSSLTLTLCSSSPRTGTPLSSSISRPE
jgi:hypothetical protein